MTGALNVQTPTEDANAATKAYVDQAVQNATDPELEGRVEALETSQATQDTEIANLKSGTTALPYIKDTGDTVTGTYDFTGADLTVKAPTAEASPATKAYVDSAVQNATDPELAERVTAVENKNTVQDGEIDALQTQMQNLQNGTINLPYLPLIGGALTGAVTTNRQNFGENELVTKKYVDKQVGNTGEHGHLEFVDAVMVPFEANYTFTKAAEDIYCILMFSNSMPVNPGTFSAFMWKDAPIPSKWQGVTFGTATNTQLNVKPSMNDATAVFVAYKFIKDGDQPTPAPDPSESFTTLSGDYSSAISVQGTGSNKASNTEALQALVDGTKGNLYKFTDHAGTVYWFTSANAVTMSGDTVTVADCDYVVGDGTMVYSGGTLVFKAWQASPADQFTELTGPYTTGTSSSSSFGNQTDLNAALNLIIANATGYNLYKVYDHEKECYFYVATQNTIPNDGQEHGYEGYFVYDEGNFTTEDGNFSLIPYNDPDAGFPPANARLAECSVSSEYEAYGTASTFNEAMTILKQNMANAGSSGTYEYYWNNPEIYVNTDNEYSIGAYSDCIYALKTGNTWTVAHGQVEWHE